jgi:phosphopantothenoylcysteine decarboxylase
MRSGGAEVKVAATEPALSFFAPEELGIGNGTTPDDPLYVRGQSTLYLDRDEWPQERLFEVGAPVVHIELRRWAEALVIAPLDANTLGKMALGLCDNLLTCIYRAWDFDRPLILAPAMNTLMWEHPATKRHLQRLLEDHGGGSAPTDLDAEALCGMINHRCERLRIAGPVTKRLACGDEGIGGMAAVGDIVDAALAAFG